MTFVNLRMLGVFSLLFALAACCPTQAQQDHYFGSDQNLNSQLPDELAARGQFEQALAAYRHLLEGKQDLPDYWIGVHCQPASETAVELHSEFDDPQQPIDTVLKGGLRVVAVIDDGPAEKAGLEQEDVIVRVDGGRVDNIQELITTIAKTGGETVQLHVLRDKAFKKIAVTPQKRQEAREWNRHVHESITAHMRGLQGILPEDVAIRIEKRGSQSIKVVFVDGDKTTEVFGGNVHELPAAYRVYAARMFHAAQALDSNAPQTSPSVLHAYHAYVQQAKKFEAVRNAGLAQRVEELSAKIDELREDLRKTND